MQSYIRVSLRVSYKPCVYEAEAATGSLLTGSRFRVYTHTASAATTSKLSLRVCRQGLCPTLAYLYKKKSLFSIPFRDNSGGFN